MERYCPPGIARFVPANKISLKFKRVHESFLSQNIFRDCKKIFCDLFVWMELENEKTETCYHFCIQQASFSVLENKQVRRSFFSVLFMPYNKSFIDQASSVKMAGYWPRSLFASLWTSTSSRSIKTQKENEANIQPS